MAPQDINEARWQALRARMDAQAGRRHTARVNESTEKAKARENRLRRTVDEAVNEAVAKLAPVVEVAPSTPAPVLESGDDEQQPPELHKLTAEQFRQHTAAAFGQATGNYGSPAWRGLPQQTPQQAADAGQGEQ
jgi:hypothetical protein